MNLKCLLSGSYGSNCFILSDKSMVIVDPGLMIDRVLREAQGLHINNLVFINTHCHFDHCGGVPDLLKALGGCYMIHEDDAEAVEKGLDEFVLAGLFGEGPVKIKVSKRLKKGDVVNLEGSNLEVIHTPGHTPGSICLYEPKSKSLLTGDTVFADGVGRTDFPGGSIEELRKSIERLIKLKETRGVKKIYPGHGPTADGDSIKKVYDMFF